MDLIGMLPELAPILPIAFTCIKYREWRRAITLCKLPTIRTLQPITTMLIRLLGLLLMPGFRGPTAAAAYALSSAPTTTRSGSGRRVVIVILDRILLIRSTRWATRS